MLNKIHIMLSLLLFFSIACSKSNQESKPTNNDNIVSWNLSSIEVGTRENYEINKIGPRPDFYEQKVTRKTVFPSIHSMSYPTDYS